MKKIFGFTLAEVLITLGIIGVVAALTMPALIANHRKTVVETRLKKFYSTINQAIKRSEVDNGPVEYWDSLTYQYVVDDDGNKTDVQDTNTIEWFNKYLAPYLVFLKIEDSKSYENKAAIYFPDGSLLLFSHSTWIFYPEAKNFVEAENQTSGLIDRNREDSGKKYFTFSFYKTSSQSGIFPYGQKDNLSEEVLLNDSTLGCSKNMPSNERAYCTLLIARNGWKIPKNYPIRF